MNDTIIQAIVNKKRLLVTYNGAERLVEPHAYGVDRNGQNKLRVFQVSEDQEHKGWRLFNESAITEVKAVDEAFENAAVGYTKDDKHLASIYAQL